MPKEVEFIDIKKKTLFKFEEKPKKRKKGSDIFDSKAY